MWFFKKDVTFPYKIFELFVAYTALLFVCLSPALSYTWSPGWTTHQIPLCTQVRCTKRLRVPVCYPPQVGTKTSMMVCLRNVLIWYWDSGNKSNTFFPLQVTQLTLLWLCIFLLTFLQTSGLRRERLSCVNSMNRNANITWHSCKKTYVVRFIFVHYSSCLTWIRLKVLNNSKVSAKCVSY